MNGQWKGEEDDKDRGKERAIEKQDGEKSQEGEMGLIEELKGGAATRETGLMAEPTAGSLG